MARVSESPRERHARMDDLRRACAQQGMEYLGFDDDDMEWIFGLAKKMIDTEEAPATVIKSDYIDVFRAASFKWDENWAVISDQRGHRTVAQFYPVKGKKNPPLPLCATEQSGL